MIYINPKFEALKPYLELVIRQGAAALRPPRCTSCGKRHVWCHGSYQRKLKEETREVGSSNPIYVHIFRYFCNFCKHTFSVLPKCVSPRRWYLWATQQAMLLLIISGRSQNDAAKQLNVGVSTCQRWVKALKNNFPLDVFHLCSRFPEQLGRSRDSFLVFWGACLKHMPFAEAMYWIYDANQAI
jgi:transposase-like protein